MKDTTVFGKRLADFVYRYVPGLWVITAYYNPAGFRTRRANYEAFAFLLRRSGIPMLTVECAFGDQPYDLPESADVIRVRSESMLWQKERLLNLAVSWLPPTCKCVAWLDCDLVFANPDWAAETVARLERVPVVQVFTTCNRLPQDYPTAIAGGNVCESFASVVGREPQVLATGKFEDHGHTGYGWAARRELLDRHGLYEYAVAGSADHYMAHAALGDIASPCIERMMLRNPSLLAHFREWAEPFHASVQGGVGAVAGEALHLWHGDLADRKYYLRHVELAELAFNPYTDLVATPGKPLEFKPVTEKQEDRLRRLKDWFQSYFTGRREDGVLTPA